ncbi:MAG TPA: HAMP domain-containing sensor histidine kinase [Gemmatimonadaceae bacterium]|nr:HAMP domain-containing sensor histidine kinase [Gemmatimonadaceae bacterium]
MLATKHDWPIDVTELKPALELALAIARADMGFLMLHDDTVGALFPVLSHGLDDTKCQLFGSPRPGVGAFGRALAEHQFVRLRHPWDEGESLNDAARSLGFNAIGVLPFFRLDGGLLGAFGLLFRKRVRSRQRMMELERFCADVVGVAVMHAAEQTRAERLRDRMAQATDAKIQFLAKMSHELRTPLQSITGYVELLRAETSHPLTPEQRHMLERITESEHILVRIIDDVITISRLEAGRVAYNIGPVSALEALRAVQIVVEPLGTQHGITVHIEPHAPGLLASADADKLKQILVNLAANAIKFTKPPGKVTLSCCTEGDVVRFDVTDTGPGIEREKLQKIFEPYVQVGAPVIDAYGGSGLGLTISREFATAMKGELSATSDVARGSVFTLRLPRHIRLTDRREAPTRRPTHTSHVSTDGNGSPML